MQNLTEETIAGSQCDGSLESLVRRIVERVLIEVRQGSEPKRVSLDEQQVTFFGNVLTIDIVKQFDARKSLTIAATTVVTPAARDELRSRGIAIVRGVSIRHDVLRAGVVPIADADGLRRCAVLARQLAARELGEVRGMGLDDLVKQVTTIGVAGFVAANMPQSIVWQLHKQHNVRAAQVADVGEIAEIDRMVRPQVWVVDMRRQSLMSAVRLVERCLRTVTNGQGDG